MSQICSEIHKIFNELPRHSFPFNKTTIPKNRIYIIFEKNKYAHGADRIVCIVTHTGEKQLFSRLQQHFVKENKDRSIFRKNIGRALLNKENDPFLEQWNWDLTTKEKKEKYLPLLNQAKQKEVENRVSEYIQTYLSFCVIHVEGKEKRLELESKIISTVSLCEDCKPLENWLGNFSPKRKIRESGLWLVNELYKKPLTFSKIERFLKYSEEKN